MRFLEYFAISFVAVALACPVLTSCSDDEEVNIIDGHEYVDLGLPSGTLWATCNVGADNPWDYGVFYAWGETTLKSSHSCSNYLDSYGWGTMGDEGVQFKKYKNESGGLVELLPSDDAATMKWGSAWRMPTVEEFNELVTKCDWFLTDSYKGRSVKGMVCFKSQAGRNYDVNTDPHIFFPAAGFEYEGDCYYFNVWGLFWAGILEGERSDMAWLLLVDMETKQIKTTTDYRSAGVSVRPVKAN